MRFRKHLWLEVKRLLGWRYLVIILVFFIAAGYFIQHGISQYKHILKEKNNFQQTEQIKVKRVVYISQLGFYGARLLFVPSPLVAFFDGGPVPQYLTAFIDSSERMKIYQPLKGHNAFSRLGSLFMNFAGFILLFGSLLVLFYGFDTLKNHEWLEFLEGITKSRKKLFGFLLAARAVLLLLICLFLAALSMILFTINGLRIDLGKVSIYTLGIFIMLLVFWLIGLGAGVVKSRFKGMAVSIITWFLLAFLIPVIIYQWTYSRSARINSPYKMEAVKQKAFMDYEGGSLKKEGKFEASKYGSNPERQMFLDFWNGGFKDVMNMEKAMLDETKNHISFFQTLSGLFPSTFFLSLSNEISSRGFSNLVKFHEYTHEMKKGFIWYLANIYIMGNKKDYAPFIKDGSNIFQGESLLPENYGFGLMVTVIWLLLLFFYFWILFNRLFNHFAEAAKELTPDNFTQNNTTVVLTSKQGLVSYLLLKLRLQEIGFVFVPAPVNLPGDVKVKDLFAFFDQPVPGKLQPLAGKYVNALEPDQKGLILFEMVRAIETDVYIFNNFLSGLSDKFYDYFADSLKAMKKGRKVVYFSNSLVVSSKIADDVMPLLNDFQLY